MCSGLRRLLLFLIIALVVATVGAEPKVSLITVLPGKSLYSAFGHTMFRVVDEAVGTDRIYNYGVSVRNFDAKFVTDMLSGKMLFMVAFQSTEMTFGYYRYKENRSIIEQALNLDKDQIASLLKTLDGDTWAENREYNYNYFTENCTTKPWKLIMPFINLDGGVGKDFGKGTVRSELGKVIGERAWFRLVLNILLGPAADRPGQGALLVFLPGQLMELLDGAKLAQARQTIYQGRDTSTIAPPLQPIVILYPLLALSLMLGLTKARRVGKVFDYFMFSIATAAGVAILIFWLKAGYPQTGYNINLLWANPIALVALVFAAKGYKPQVAKWMFFASAVLAGLVAVFGGFGIQIVGWEIRVLAAIIALRSLFQVKLTNGV